MSCCRLVLVLSLSLVACSSSNGPSDLATAQDLGSDLTIVQTVAVSGKLVQMSGGPMALAGAQVCRHPEGTPCASSDASGLYVLEGLPFDTDFALKISGGADFVDDVFPFHLTSDRSAVNIVVPKRTGQTMLAATAGATLDATKAGIIVNVAPKNSLIDIQGGTIALVGASADGPFYFTGTDSSATTSANIQGYPGFTLFFNVPVGSDLEVGITPPAGKSCTVDFGWSGTSGRVKLPVAAGAATSVAFICS
jgi:hypothetical protein